MRSCRIGVLSGCGVGSKISEEVAGILDAATGPAPSSAGVLTRMTTHAAETSPDRPARQVACAVSTRRALRSSAMTKRDRWADDDILENFRKREYLVLEIREGMTLTHTGSRFTGTVAEFTQGGQLVLVDKWDERRSFPSHDGAFMHNGVRVAMREPAAAPQGARRFTASGSIETDRSRARVARASRIWVEGLHDAELIEKIWGDDLREAAIVVEPMHGADDLLSAVEQLRPGPDRKLGVLLDHLVKGSKETRIAQSVKHSDVLVLGHPYVDIWQAIKPITFGIAEWPEVPRGEPWKEGVIRGLGMNVDPGRFWTKVLESVSSYKDVETPLVNAVEQLIDFVTVDDKKP